MMLELKGKPPIDKLSPSNREFLKLLNDMASHMNQNCGTQFK